MREHEKTRDTRVTAFPRMAFPYLLYAAYQAIRPQGAAGAVTWACYGTNLEANLPDLHRRVPQRRLPGEPFA
jgi:hypothetical protein